MTEEKKESIKNQSNEIQNQEKKLEQLNQLYTVEELFNIKYKINLEADYQRDNIWDDERKARLINSMIKEIDIPKIYFAKVKDMYDCVDGKQRLSAIFEFFDGKKEEKLKTWINDADEDKKNKHIDVLGLKNEHSEIYERIYKKYSLTITFLPKTDSKFIAETFKRLQLGVPLNSGELLHTLRGGMSDFIFKSLGKNAPFFRNSKISDKRFSREFAIAQICINSFSRNNNNQFCRAREEDIENFFEANGNLEKNNNHFKRIENVLHEMDIAFGKNAEKITSRAVAVSLYLFIEELYKNKKEDIPKFAEFYLILQDEIKAEQKKLNKLHEVKNKKIMEAFQKYVLQASVETKSIERRHKFLKNAFEHYKKTGKVPDDNVKFPK